MSYEANAAKRYRLHAEELRTIAEYDGHEETRRSLLQTAKGYDVMADTFEKIEQTNRSVGKG